MSSNNTPNVPMSTIMDSHFTRVERALETLIKSLSTYNPSPSLANGLVLADSELNDGLEQLHTHQTNYARILSLRALSTDLDSQIKDALLLLTNTRSEVLSTPGTKFPETVNAVNYEELLSYARRISKTTLPGTYREADENGAPPRDSTPKEGATTNGNSTPVATTINGAENAARAGATGTAQAPGEVHDEVKEDEHSTALPPQFIPATTLPPTAFIPWPHDMLLRRGALATIQVLTERGEEIEGYDPGEEGGKGKPAVVEEEPQRRESMVTVPAVRLDGTGHAEGHAQAHGGQVQVQKPKKAFELETFEDDDDDEDD